MSSIPPSRRRDQEFPTRLARRIGSPSDPLRWRAMVPDLPTTLRWRAIARALPRMFGLLCLPAGGFFLAAWLIEGISDRDLWNFRYYYWRVINAVLFLAWGVLGLGFGGLVARFLLPLPKHPWPPRCPYCRYELVTLREARCPECGRTLTEEYALASRRPPQGGA